MNKALFLDRDGIVNVDKGYVYRWEDIEWFDEIFDIIRLANKKHYKVIILTNQSGIFQKKYSHEDVEILHKKMHDHLSSLGLMIDAWYYCAEMDSERRKPKPGMLYEAQRNFHINLSESFMVGDKLTDVFVTPLGEAKPFTFLVQGKYDLTLSHSVDVSKELKIVANHRELKEVLELTL